MLKIILYIQILVFLLLILSNLAKKRIDAWAVFVIVIFYIASLFFGLMVYAFSGIANDSFYDLNVSRHQMFESASGFIVACISLVIGSCSVSLFFKKSAARTDLIPRSSCDAANTRLRSRPKYAWVIVFFVSLLSILLLSIGIGIESILIRMTYLSVNWHLGHVIGAALCPFCIVALGYVYEANRKYLLRKFVILIPAFLIAMLFFSMASRRFALIPLLFACGKWMWDTSSRKNMRAMFFATIIAFLIVPIPLSLRRLNEYGLIPFFAAIFSGGVDWSGMANSLMNIFFSLPLAAYIKSLPRLGYAHFIMSINPMPGWFVGWYQVASEFRVNKYIPYSGLGELMNYGWAALSAYYGVVGSLLTFLETKARLSKEPHKRFVVIAFGMLFAIFSVQYNLRSCTRLIYYSVIIYVAVTMASKLRRNLGHR